MTEADQGLDSFFPYRLAVAAEAFSRSLSQVYGQDHGLSREEWRMLFLLAGEEDVTSTDLARRTTLDKVQVSRAAVGRQGVDCARGSRTGLASARVPVYGRRQNTVPSASADGGSAGHRYS